jgi:hypothetical protein
MKSKHREVIELETELMRLNALVRARRQTLAKLAQTCPNNGCECRAFWKEETEKSLAKQVGKIRRTVATRNGAASPSTPKTSKPAAKKA